MHGLFASEKIEVFVDSLSINQPFYSAKLETAYTSKFGQKCDFCVHCGDAGTDTHNRTTPRGVMYYPGFVINNPETP